MIESGAGQCRLCQVARACQIRPFQISLCEICVMSLTGAEIGVLQVGFRQVRLAEIGCLNLAGS